MKITRKPTLSEIDFAILKANTTEGWELRYSYELLDMSRGNQDPVFWAVMQYTCIHDDEEGYSAQFVGDIHEQVMKLYENGIDFVPFVRIMGKDGFPSYAVVSEDPAVCKFLHKLTKACEA